MPRTLPWLADGVGGASRRSPLLSKKVQPLDRSSREAQKKSDSHIQSHEPSSSLVPRSDSHETTKPVLSGRQSPAAPQIEYMREGPDQDDGWMMVEDEFLATARLFTKHVHYAAYAEWQDRHSRKRQLAETDSSEIPTANKPIHSHSSRLKMDGRLMAEGRDDLGGQSYDSDEMDGNGTHPLLAGLINGSQRKAQDWATLPRYQPKTRAAAGYMQSPRKPKPEKPSFTQWNDSTIALNLQKPSSVPVTNLADTDDSEDLDRDVRPRDSIVSERSIKTANKSKVARGEVAPSPHDMLQERDSSPTPKSSRVDQPGSPETAKVLSTASPRQALSHNSIARRQARIHKHKERPPESETRTEEVPTWLV